VNASVDALRAWCDAHLTLVRAAMFFCSFGWWWLLKAWIKPTPVELRRAALAAWFQFWFGLDADALLVQFGAWHYRPMGGTWHGVPIDLHVNWTLLWGFGFVWIARRIFRRPRGWRGPLLYLVAWIVVTVAFDVLIRHWMLFVRSAAPWWWIADVAFLASVLGVTLWLERSIGHDAGECIDLAGLRVALLFLRSAAWAGGFVWLFFVWLPPLVDRLARVGPTRSFDVVALALSALGVVLGGLAIAELALRGGGTPIPWDPPRRLVTSGLYAHVANPIQIAGLLLGAACFAERPTWPRAIYLLDLFVVALVVFRSYERHELERRFGAAGRAYLDEVRAWIPRLTPFTRPAGPLPRRSRAARRAGAGPLAPARRTVPRPSARPCRVHRGIE